MTERRRAWWRAWRMKNAERINAKKRERYAAKGRPPKLSDQELHDRHLAAQRRYYEANRWRYRAYFHEYKARRMNADMGVTTAQVKELFARYRGLCAYCAEPHGDTIEHVVPLSRGGKHEIGNLLPVCSRCNKSKNDRTLEEWVA